MFPRQRYGCGTWTGGRKLTHEDSYSEIHFNARGRSFSHRSQLSSHDLRMPLRIECNAQDRAAMVTNELKYGHCPWRVLITGTELDDEYVRDCIAVGALAVHGYLFPRRGSVVQGHGHG